MTHPNDMHAHFMKEKYTWSVLLLMDAASFFQSLCIKARLPTRSGGRM